MPTDQPRPHSLTAIGSATYGLGRLLIWAMSLFPVVIALLLGVGLALPATQREATRLLAENQLIENLTGVGYLVGCALALGMALRMRSQGRARAFGIWAAAAVVCFGLAGEEVSWGQQIWHFRSPALIQEVNYQRETNVHNLPGLHELGDWIPLVFTAVPLIAIVTHTRRREERSGVPTLLLPYAVVIVLLAGWARVDSALVGTHVPLALAIVIGRLQELVEMLFSFAIAYGVWAALRRDRRPDAAHEPQRGKYASPGTS